MKSVVFVSALLPVSSSTGVTDLFVIATDHGSCDRVGTRGNSDGNLNQGLSHGAKLGLCWESVKDGERISDLKLMKADKGSDWEQGLCQKLGSGWQAVEGRKGANGDLNQGNHGKYITLCKKHDDQHQQAIISVILQSDENCQSGYDLVSGNNGDSNLNQHGHGNGKKNYLCMQKKKCDPIEKDIKGYWKPGKRVKVGESFSFSMGITESHTSSWSDSVSNSITHSKTKVQFDAQGSSTTSCNSNTNTVGNVFSESSTTTFSVTKTDTIPFSKAGQVWQWVTEVPTECGTTTLSYSNRIVLSTDPGTYPCCYPDFTLDPEDSSKCLSDAGILKDGEKPRFGCKSNSKDDGQKPGESGRVEELDLDAVEVV